MKFGVGSLFGCICFWCVLITSIVLFALSFGIVDLDEWGIVNDTTWSEVYSKPYGSGRYFVGLGKQFIIYPRSMQYITFNADADSQANRLEAWTKEDAGLDVYVDGTMFFKLNETKLYDFYFEVGDFWYAYLVRCFYSAVKTITVEFETTQYFDQRVVIGEAIKKNVISRFEKISNGAVIVEEFELRYIAFHPDIEQILERKLIQSQLKKTAEQLNITHTIQKQTDQIFTEANNKIAIINAEAQKTGYVTEAEAQSKFFSTVFKSYVDSYADLFTNLQITTNEEKLKFFYATELPEINANIKSFVGFKQPVV